MVELHFEINTSWSGTGRQGEGNLQIWNKNLPVSAPENMGGKGIGASPEELLIAAVTTCYNGTLVGVLRKKGLPAHHVHVVAEGVVEGYPLQARFAKLVVNPEIHGGDPLRTAEYEQAARTARDKCFIGKTIEGNVAYTVGEVKVLAENLKQEQINQLVELFYTNLMKDTYYSHMFKEKQVDIDLLKERQRTFIARLANESGAEIGRGEVQQVQQRHSFGVNPERAQIWLQIMKKTMEEMGLTAGVREPLLEKIRFLVDKMTQNQPERP